MSDALATPPPLPVRPPWPPARRVLFRFLFVYVGLYLFSDVTGLLPVVATVGELFEKVQRAVVPPFARYVLRIGTPAVWHPTGSGDALFNWVSLVLFALVAALATVAWTRLAPRPEHHRLREALRVFVRYALGATMLSYGMSKVFPIQFPPVDPSRLMEPYGWYSPMGVVWAFMGTSAVYQIASGLGETIGALLLFFRRTVTPGALLLLGVLGNVALLNLCFDIPVKQYSLHLWLMALWLAWPDLPALFDLLVRRRPVQPAPVDWCIASRRRRIALLAGKALLLTWLLLSHTRGAWQGNHEYGPGRTPRPFEGFWKVERASAGGWRRLGIGPWRATVVTADDPYLAYGVTWEDRTQALTFRLGKEKLVFKVHVAGDELELDGPFQVKLRRAEQAPLLGRGFHWVQEYPYNR